MNTTAWLISFADSSGKQRQTVHTHNCVADFRVIDKNATAQEIDCAAVADLINLSRVIDSEFRSDPMAVQCFDLGVLKRWQAALANVGRAP